MNGLLQELVTTQAELRPDAPAIVWQDQEMTYREVERQSNRLARALFESGCARGDRVCLLAPKSADALIAILAIYKADCAYVPLDPEGTAARLANIVRICEPRAVLVTQSSAALLDDSMRESVAGVHPVTVSLDPTPIVARRFKTAFCLADVSSASDQPMSYQNRAASPAHILFTSSTGAPKGVVITHANVRHFVSWANCYFDVRPDDRQSAHSPLTFDLSIYDIFGTLAAGASLFPVPLGLNILPNTLADFIRTNKLTQWFSEPSVLKFMAQHDVVDRKDFSTLRRVIWCGQPLSTPTLRYWMARVPHSRFTNLYGATETTIASSYYTVPSRPHDDDEPIPIGTACPGEELYVLDDEFRATTPNTVGEIYIRGVGLSPGYWRDSEATHKAFLPNLHSGDPLDRIYRTADLGRRDRDGLFYFVGRRASQVKSRGRWIELEEVEAALQALPSLRATAVVALPADGFEGAVLCCAYVPAPGRHLSPTVLRKRLAKLVPAYMLPTRWKELKRLPLNPKGEIDRDQVQRSFVDGGVLAR